MNYLELFEAMGFVFDLEEVLPPPHKFITTHRLKIVALPDELMSDAVFARLRDGLAKVTRDVIRQLEYRREEEFRQQYDLFFGGPLDGEQVRYDSFWNEGEFRVFAYKAAQWAVYQRIGQNLGAKFVGYSSSERKGRRGILLATGK